ncbi:GLPGLI family protein [Yeosuana sp. AK3]
MKKETIIIAFVFLLSNISISQINKGQITYSLNLDKIYLNDVQNNIHNKNSEINRLIVKSAHNIELELYFEGRKSFFREKKSMSIGDEFEDNLKIMVRAFSFHADRLTDLDEKSQILVRENEGKLMYIKTLAKERKWNLTKESKKIAGFTCYKATFSKKVPSGNYIITAWYTPDIPIQFGPEEYYGELPGLILELHDILAVYSCTSIKLNPKTSLKIEWPNKNDIISEEKYKKEGDKLGKIMRQ